MKDEARQSEAGGRLWLPRLVGDRCDMSHFAVFPTVIYLHLGSVKSYCMCQKTLKIYSVYQEKDAVLFKKANDSLYNQYKGWLKIWFCRPSREMMSHAWPIWAQEYGKERKPSRFGVATVQQAAILTHFCHPKIRIQPRQSWHVTIMIWNCNL